MTINLKEMAKRHLDNIPGNDLNAIIMFAVANEEHVSCTIAGEASPLKAMLCSILEHDEPRALFEECYSMVLAKRAGMSSDEINRSINNN